MIYDFLSILRRRLNMKMHAVMFTFNFYQIVQTLSEVFVLLFIQLFYSLTYLHHQELKPSVTLSYVLRYANIKNDTEISAESIIKLGLKYPVLFFSLIRFRNHMRLVLLPSHLLIHLLTHSFRRIIFGDKFWANQKLIKPRTEFHKNDIDPLLYIDGTVDEDAAVVCTARSIITDYAKGNMTIIKLVEEYPQQVTYVDTELSVKMKTLLGVYILYSLTYLLTHSLVTGYKMARKLIIESKLPYAETELYVDVPDEEGDEDIRMHDPMIQLDFSYNAGNSLTYSLTHLLTHIYSLAYIGTGLHSWYKSYFDPVTGDPIRETATRFTPNLSEINERKNSMQESGEDAKHGELKNLTMAKEKKKKNK